MPQSRLKILYLEDVQQDAELVIEKLNSEGLEMEIDLVSSEKGFVDLLTSKTYDLILSDYNLPMYNGIAALKQVQKVCPEVPLICVSGTIGEDLAVELLKEGAADYVLKDRLERLPYAIRRALNDVEEKHARKVAEAELKKLSKAVENSPVSICITDKNGIIEYANPRVYEMSGYSVEEVIGNKTAILRSGVDA